MSETRRETLPLKNSNDVVLARQKVRQWATELRFTLVDQTKLVTAASELARNTLDHGKGGTMTIEQTGHPGCRNGPQRWIHHRQRHGAGAGWQQAPGE